jgi:hypothetical protein
VEVRQRLVSFRALGLRGVNHSLAMEFFVERDRSLRSREPIEITGCRLQLHFSPRSETSIFCHREAEIHFVPFARVIATKAADKSPCVAFGSKPFKALVANDRGPAIAVLNDRNSRIVGWLHGLSFGNGRSGSVRWAYFRAKISGRQAAPAARYSPSTRRRCSSRISSAMLVRDSRTSSANGAFGRHDRQDNAGMRLVTAASW